MPQSLRNTNDIITRALYLIGELSPDELPSDSQVSEGLYYLNDLFDYFASLGIFIPFIRKLEFTMTSNKDEYTISNVIPADINFERIVELDYVNIIREQISYPVRVIKRSELFNNTRLTNIKTRPGYVILEREVQQSRLKFYPVPEFPYECVVRAKFMLDRLELFDQIDEIPPYYYRFLRYALARELKDVYPSSNWSAQAEESYQSMLKNMTASSDLDMAIYPDNILMDKFGEFVYESFGIFS